MWSGLGANLASMRTGMTPSQKSRAILEPNTSHTLQWPKHRLRSKQDMACHCNPAQVHRTVDDWLSNQEWASTSRCQLGQLMLHAVVSPARWNTGELTWQPGKNSFIKAPTLMVPITLVNFLPWFTHWLNYTSGAIIKPAFIQIPERPLLGSEKRRQKRP